MLQFQELISYFENSTLADNIRENDVLFPLSHKSVHVVFDLPGDRLYPGG